MPTVRYQIRNEYGLADPELHSAADKDDPEAILEGVAMAGLVGVLRQLGDLAEFAVEVFRDLHEEVMGTAARGHGLMLRVQQLEAEFPSVEKSLFSQSSHSSFAYNNAAGIDWHCNVHMDQNLITQGDMPRFILDSYEECRGPPRLFTLDKFDTAGAGACLKRYSDPSFFKMELVSSVLMESDIPREKKFRKTRKKGSRWKNGQTLESLLSPHANLNLQSTTSDQVSDKSATRLVRLKSRNLNGTNGSKGVSLRKRLLELHSDEQKVVFDNSRSCSNINVNSGDSGELTSKMHDTIMDMSANHPSARDVNPTKTPTKVVAMLTTYELDHWKKEDEELSEAQHEPFDEVQNPQRKFNFVEKKERFADSENNSEGSAYDYELSNPEKTTSLLDDMLVGAELKLEGSTDGSRTEDIGSEQENFMDALNSMESEIEADSENKDRPYLGILIKEIHEVDFDTSERLEELQTEISELDSAEVSTVSVGLNNILMSGISSVPYSSTLSNLAEIPATQDKVVASNSSEATEFFLGKTHDESWEELLPHDDVSNSADMISGGTNNMKTFHSLRSDIREETCSSCVINSTSSLINIDSQEGFDALQLINANQNDTPAGHEAQLGGTDEISKCLDGSPHSDSCPVKPHHAEHVDELILEDMMEILEMPNDLSCSPTRSASIEETLEMPNDLSCSPTRSSSIDDPDNQDSSIMTVPTVKEMQHSMDRDTKAFPSKEDTAASSGGRSILTSIIAFVPDTSMDVVQHDGLVADINNGQHPEDLTIEASFDYVKGTDDVVQNMNGSFVGTEDDNVPCHPVELTSEEMSFRPDMSDHLSDAKHESSLAKDFGWYIEVPQHHSNVTIGKSQQSMNQDEGNSTETVSLPIHAIATIRDKDCMTEMENIVAVENQSYLRPEVGFENTNDMAESNLAMPEILQSQLEYFSDTEESRESPEVDSAEKFQESLKVNVAEEPQESPKVNSAEASEESPRVNSAEPVSLCSDSDSHTQESQEFSKVDLAEESQESPKMNSAEQVSSCSESETFSDRLMNPPVLVLDDLKLPNEFNQDNLQKNIQEVEQIIYVKNLSAEKFASEDETNNHDTSLVYTQEASGIQSQLLEDSTVDAAVSYQHPLKTHETCSPKMVEVLDSQNTLNMEVSSEVEQSALDPAASCSGLPAKDSSNANVAGLLGDICDMMPAEHVQAYLHTCVGDTYSEDPVQSKQEFGSKSLAQGHHGSAKQEMSLSTNLFSDSASLSEEVSTSQPSDEVEVEPELSHQKCEYLEHDIPTNSVDVYDKPSDGPEPSYHAILNNVKNNELDMLPSNTDLTKNLCSEALISSECSSEISACHMASNISVMTFSLLSSSDVAFTESASRLSYEPHSDEVTSCFPSQHPEGPPPLPPIEWRTRKVQLSTLLPDENLSQSLAETNPSMVPSDSKSANPFMAPPFGLSELLPNVGDQNHQHNALSLEGNIVHSLSASSSISLSLEHEKSLCAPDAQWGSKLPLADSFTPSPVLKSQISQHSASQEERIQPISDKRFQLNQLWPGSELEKSHHSELSHLNLEKEMIQPQNPFLVEYVLGDVNHHHNYGDFGGENVHLLKSSEFSPSLGLDMPHPSCVYSSERSRSILFGVVPTREDEWFSIKPHSILNRPRNPLIEAVVAHDRSTLRKVSELARPSNESKADKKDALLESNILQLRKVSEIVKPSNEPKADERDALLEQIRNKSFSLKPTVLSKPNTKGHPTNIKVAAIVEKANALRQAVAGSDEEDGGDSWSDC